MEFETVRSDFRCDHVRVYQTIRDFREVIFVVRIPNSAGVLSGHYNGALRAFDAETNGQDNTKSV